MPQEPIRAATQRLALAEVHAERDGDRWTLVFVRDLRHPPDKVWGALTEPEQGARWAPFTSSGPLDTLGDVTLTMIDGEEREDHPATIRRAEAPVLLEYTWADDLLRWELDPTTSGTRLTLRHTVGDRSLLDQVAAGWDLCLQVADALLAGEAVRAIRGQDAMAHGWSELRDAYAERLAAT